MLQSTHYLGGIGNEMERRVNSSPRTWKLFDPLYIPVLHSGVARTWLLGCNPCTVGLTSRPKRMVCLSGAYKAIYRIAMLPGKRGCSIIKITRPLFVRDSIIYSLLYVGLYDGMANPRALLQ